MAEAEPILCAIDRRGVATVTLNRPRVGNAYDGALIDALIATFARLAEEPGLRCVVLKGAGHNFQAGADLSFLEHLSTVSPEENREFSRRTVAAIRGLQLSPRPTIALIQGGCFGGGVGIAAACDIAVAAEDAVFALSEVRWGITPAPIIPLLVERIGARAAGRLALTGERFDAAMALRIGLVHELCPAAELDEFGARFVEHLLMAGPEAVAITKQLIAEAVETPFAGAFHDRIVEEAASRRRSQEAAEGLASFREKRKPRWYPEPEGRR
jgi:methylglutaconyl-CoA hydratase